MKPKVREVRQKQGISLRDLAQAIGMAKTPLAYRELGVYPFRINELEQIAIVLKVDMENLYEADLLMAAQQATHPSTGA